MTSSCTMQFADCKTDAMRLLREHGVPAAKIVTVEPDRILYVDQEQHAHTAIIHRPAGVRASIRLEIVDGFPA